MRVVTRDPARAADLTGAGIEVAVGDVRDSNSIERAMVGAQTVISAIQGFSGTGGDNPESVGRVGNGVLMRAARAAGAAHFILVSVQGAAPDHPMDLFRAKHLAEQEPRSSGLVWTIIRPAAYMETWAQLVGKPLVETGQTRIFGRGNNPINVVAADDVARFVELAAVDPALRGQVVAVGGPENLTMRQVVATFQTVTGKTGKVSHVPLPAMRALAVLLRPVNATVARQIQAGVVMDTRDMTFDPPRRSGATRPLFPPHWRRWWRGTLAPAVKGRSRRAPRVATRTTPTSAIQSGAASLSPGSIRWPGERPRWAHTPNSRRAALIGRSRAGSPGRSRGRKRGAPAGSAALRIARRRERPLSLPPIAREWRGAFVAPVLDGDLEPGEQRELAVALQPL